MTRLCSTMVTVGLLVAAPACDSAPTTPPAAAPGFGSSAGTAGFGSGVAGFGANPAEAEVSAWSRATYVFDKRAEGDPERVQALIKASVAYARVKLDKPELDEFVPLEDWELQLDEWFTVEFEYWQGIHDNWRGEVPEDYEDRPTHMLRRLHAAYARYRASQDAASEEFEDHLVAMLAVDRAHDERGEIWSDDTHVLELIEDRYGEEVVYASCRAATDAVPKKPANKRVMVMYTCAATHPERWREELAWATNKERAAFEAAHGAGWDAQLQAYRDEANAASEEPSDPSLYDEYVAGGGSSSSSGSSDSIAVTLRSSCSRAVKLFYGAKPKFGSGRQSSINANTRTSQRLRVGDMIWIVDDEGEGVASVTISSSTREVEVTGSCTSLRAK